VGARGVIALGVLGEAARLDAEERALVLSTVVAAAQGLPVVAGMSALATAPAVEEARRAAALGARAVMVRVPTTDSRALAGHVRTVADAAGLGIVLQDHPASTGITIAPSALSQAVRDSGVVVAIKAEAPPTAPTIAALASEVDMPIFGGLGGVSLLDELLAGSAGAMTGFAVPEALVAIVGAWGEGGFEAAREQILPWLPLLLFEAQEKYSLSVRKEILRRRGILAESGVRFPGLPMPDSVRRALDVHLASSALPSVHTESVPL
jgi:4-hydroxy-tetrahydrodipicolinate synthase